MNRELCYDSLGLMSRQAGTIRCGTLSGEWALNVGFAVPGE